jgi:hypothetical protein
MDRLAGAKWKGDSLARRGRARARKRASEEYALCHLWKLREHLFRSVQAFLSSSCLLVGVFSFPVSLSSYGLYAKDIGNWVMKNHNKETGWRMNYSKMHLDGTQELVMSINL